MSDKKIIKQIRKLSKMVKSAQKRDYLSTEDLFVILHLLDEIEAGLRNRI